MTFAPAMFEIATFYGLGGHARKTLILFYFDRNVQSLGGDARKYIIPFLTLILWSMHMKGCQVPSTSCAICTCKVCSCYIQWFRRRCIRIKYIFDLDLGASRSSSTPSLHLQSLKLLRPTVKEEMHWQGLWC